MACACKVNQQITYLQRKYGTNVPKNKKTDIGFEISYFFKRVFEFIVVVITTPAMWLFTLFTRLVSKKKVIDINKLVGLSKYERNKQNIPNKNRFRYQQQYQR